MKYCEDVERGGFFCIFGLLISKDFSENTSISYSSIFGNEQEDQSTLKQFRAYQNIYFNTSSKDWELIVGGDLGMQTNTKNGDETAVMYNALLTLRYSINEQLSITGRGELFKDPVGFISGEIEFPNQITKGLEVYGLTFGSAYKPSSNSYIRVEARMLNELDGQALFNNSNNPASRVEVMLTLGAFINEWEIWRKRK